MPSGGFSRVSRSSPSPTQPSRQSKAPAEPKAAQKLHLSNPQTSQAEHLMKSKLMSEREMLSLWFSLQKADVLSVMSLLSHLDWFEGKALNSVNVHCLNIKLICTHILV